MGAYLQILEILGGNTKNSLIRALANTLSPPPNELELNQIWHPSNNYPPMKL